MYAFIIKFVVAWEPHVAKYIWVNIDSDNGLLLDDTKWLP